VRQVSHLPEAVRIPVFKITLKPCFLIYFSSQNPKKAAELAEELLHVRNKSHIQLSTSICISLCALHAKNQRLTSNWSVTWSFHLTYQLCLWQDLLTDLTTEKGSLWFEAATDSLCLISDGTCRVATRILIGTYKFRNSSKTFLPLRIFVSRNPWHPFAKRWSSEELSL